MISVGNPLDSFPAKDLLIALVGGDGGRRVLFADQERFPAGGMFLQQTNSSQCKDGELLSQCIIPPQTPLARFSGNLRYTLGMLWLSDAEFRELPVKR